MYEARSTISWFESTPEYVPRFHILASKFSSPLRGTSTMKDMKGRCVTKERHPNTMISLGQYTFSRLLDSCNSCQMMGDLPEFRVSEELPQGEPCYRELGLHTPSTRLRGMFADVSSFCQHFAWTRWKSYGWYFSETRHVKCSLKVGGRRWGKLTSA